MKTWPLRTSNGWIEKSQQIIEETVRYFNNHFATSNWNQPRLDALDFLTVLEEDNMELIESFSLLELEDVVRDSDGTKSPELDGFNFT